MEKQIISFPKLESNVIDRFKELGHADEVLRLNESLLETYESINKTGELISVKNVYEALMKIPVEQDDEVLAIYRSDQDSDFWASKGSEHYLNYIRSNGDKVRLTRIIVCDSYHLIKRYPNEMIVRLASLHPPGTLMQIDKSLVNDNYLLGYRFGITIFPRLKCAIAPVPVPLSYTEYMNNYGIPKAGQLFPYYTERHFLNPELKAILITDPAKVENLITQFRELLLNSSTKVVDYAEVNAAYIKLKEDNGLDPNEEYLIKHISDSLSAKLTTTNLWKMSHYCYLLMPTEKYNIPLAIIHFALERLATFKEQNLDDESEFEYDELVRDLSQQTLMGNENAMLELSRMRFR